MPNDLNLELSQRVSVALAFLLVGVTVAAAVYWGAYFLVPLMALLLLLLSRYWLEFATGRRSAPVLLALGSLVGLIVWLAVRNHMPYIVYPLAVGMPAAPGASPLRGYAGHARDAVSRIDQSPSTSWGLPPTWPRTCPITGSSSASS